jgi:hypothetical protein
VLIAVVLLRLNPQQEPAYARGGSAEAQFYLEIYQQVVAEEPRGAAPIRGLFEEKER